MSQETWKVGTRLVAPADPDTLDSDPRGILFIYEPPRPGSAYILGVDPTVGKTGWNRYARVDDDARIDNAVIQVLRKGTPDVQVAEFAAPIDAVDLAPVVNAIGRMYSGNSEDGMAHCICESTGPGAVTIRELVDRFGYTNMFLWRYYAGSMSSRLPVGGRIGWFSSRSANKDLWMRGLHHIHKGRIRVHSSALVEEMTDCMADAYTLIGEARNGRHDDRVMALLFAIWAAHDWALGEEPVESSVMSLGAPKNQQAMDCSYEQMVDDWEEQFANLVGNE